MSLYINQINEALSEDQAINREVVRRMKRNYQDNTEKMEAEADLDQTAQAILMRYFSVFEKDLFILISNIERGGEVDVESIVNIIKSYNDVCIFLTKMSYNKMNLNAKNAIILKFKSYIPSLSLIEEQLSKLVSDEVITPIIELKKNIQNTLFIPIGYSLEQYVAKDESQKRVREREQLEQATTEDVKKELKDNIPLSTINTITTDTLLSFLGIAKKLGFAGKPNVSQVKKFLAETKKQLNTKPIVKK